MEESCRACGAQSQRAQKYCGTCGALLNADAAPSSAPPSPGSALSEGEACDHCGAGVPPDQRYCGECGTFRRRTRISGTTAPASAPRSEAVSPAARAAPTTEAPPSRGVGTWCGSCHVRAEPGATFCHMCGRDLSGGARVAAGAAAPQPQPPSRGGRIQPPANVVIFTLLTFGIYAMFWMWRITRELETLLGRPDRPHRRLRTSLLLTFSGLVLMFASIGAAVSSSAEGEAWSGADTAVMIGVVLLIAGAVALLMTYWLVLQIVKQEEQRRGMQPLSPGLMLALILIPYVNYVGFFVFQHRLQKGLNGLWGMIR